VQIDFHHATTYVLARLAGFTHEQADVIAHSAEYVDDATNDGLVRFDNGALSRRLASAHKMLELCTRRQSDPAPLQRLGITMFLGSRWKMFHDAAQAHRLDVLQVILPRYGICAA
jgi:hypothetical protein